MRMGRPLPEEAELKIPPDVQVIKLLSQQRELNQDLSKMTDEELEKLESDVVAKIMENKGC